MKRIYFLLSFFPLLSEAQSVQFGDTISAPSFYENVFVKPISSDSLSSSFFIFIKKEVKMHKHLSHTENVYVLEGEGEMLLGDKHISIKKGDVIFIPKNTPHSLKVTSISPVKIISIQSPHFDGKDRVFIE